MKLFCFYFPWGSKYWISRIIGLSLTLILNLLWHDAIIVIIISLFFFLTSFSLLANVVFGCLIRSLFSYSTFRPLRRYFLPLKIQYPQNHYASYLNITEIWYHSREQLAGHFRSSGVTHSGLFGRVTVALGCS